MDAKAIGAQALGWQARRESLERLDSLQASLTARTLDRFLLLAMLFTNNGTFSGKKASPLSGNWKVDNLLSVSKLLATGATA